jgi:hypothetical protein
MRKSSLTVLRKTKKVLTRYRRTLSTPLTSIVSYSLLRPTHFRFIERITAMPSKMPTTKKPSKSPTRKLEKSLKAKSTAKKKLRASTSSGAHKGPQKLALSENNVIPILRQRKKPSLVKAVNPAQISEPISNSQAELATIASMSISNKCVGSVPTDYASSLLRELDQMGQELRTFVKLPDGRPYKRLTDISNLNASKPSRNSWYNIAVGFVYLAIVLSVITFCSFIIIGEVR